MVETAIAEVQRLHCLEKAAGPCCLEKLPAEPAVGAAAAAAALCCLEKAAAKPAVETAAGAAGSCFLEKVAVELNRLWKGLWEWL